MPDGRHARGERTRIAVLTRAADVASVEGLDGVSIGRLAADLDISKAGVFAHFGSKEELQLATIRAATERFVGEVVEPASAEPDGLARLWSLCEHWIVYARTGVFPGGCFFLNVASEYDARPGRVRDELAGARRRWLGLYERAIDVARAQGELDTGVAPTDLAFELDALGMAANLHSQLCDDPVVFDQARSAMLDRLRRLATAPRSLPTV
jgi:AcrR family transcriptional regulator